MSIEFFTTGDIFASDSIAIPALGCGLGGLSWNAVRSIIERAALRMSVTRVVVYEPGAR